MNADPGDDLDRAIDEALAAAVVGEPRHVDAASVRRALAERVPSRLPVWLGLAAALVIAGGVAFLGRSEESGSPTVASGTIDAGPAEARVVGAPSPSSGPLAADEIVPTRLAVAPPPRSRSEGEPKQSPDLTTEPPYEGLPRLTIVPLDPPDSLTPFEFENRAISIAAIEIAPLTLARLSNELEQ